MEQNNNTQGFQGNNQGFIAQPRVFLSRDGEYLIHIVPGGVIRKHINFYKKILGQEFTPKAKAHATA